MNTYIIGDVQGCFDELQKLLSKVDYQSGRIISGLLATSSIADPATWKYLT